MVPIPRFTTVKGIPVTELLKKSTIDALLKRTSSGGAEIVGLLRQEVHIMRLPQQCYRWSNQSFMTKRGCCPALYI